MEHWKSGSKLDGLRRLAWLNVVSVEMNELRRAEDIRR